MKSKPLPTSQKGTSAFRMSWSVGSTLLRRGWEGLLLLSIIILASCGSDRKTFLLEGTFKGFNQGELYIYGMNGSHRLDTISVVKGQLHYEILLEDTVTLSLVFPNFSVSSAFSLKDLPVWWSIQSQMICAWRFDFHVDLSFGFS